MLRAAEVRRRSIESQQTQTAAGAGAKKKQSETHQSVLTPTGTVSVEPSDHAKPVTVKDSVKNATSTTTTTATAVRPKSRVYTPKAPAAADTHTTAANNTTTAATVSAPRPKSRLYTPKAPSDNTTGAGPSVRQKSGAVSTAPHTPRAPKTDSATVGSRPNSLSPRSPRTVEKEKPSLSDTQRLKSSVKGDAEIPSTVVSSTEGNRVPGMVITAENPTVETVVMTTVQDTLETAAVTTEQQHTLETAAMITTESIQEDIQTLPVSNNDDNKTVESKQEIESTVVTEEDAVVPVVVDGEVDMSASVVLKEESRVARSDKESIAEYSMDFEGSSQIVE